MTSTKQRSHPALGKESPSKNFLTVQALRGVAALLVVLNHALEVWGERVDITSPGGAWTNGAAGVDIFFVISGFVMVVASRRVAGMTGGWLVFLRNRFVRIVPLYWILTTLKVAAVAVFSGAVLRTKLEFNFVAASYLFLPVVDSAGHFRPVLPVGWTLTFEFLFYLLFAVALAAQVSVLRVIVPGLSLIALAALSKSATWPVWSLLFDTIVLEFLFGVILAKITLRGLHLNFGTALALFFVGFVFLLAQPMVSANARVLTWGIPAFAVVAGAVSLERTIGGSLPRWLLISGDASYSIYLTHGFVLPLIVFLSSNLLSSGSWTQAVTVAMCLLVSSAVGWTVFILVEGPLLRAFTMRRATSRVTHSLG